MSTALATRPQRIDLAIPEDTLERLLKTVILKNASDDQVRLVTLICLQLRLNPLLKHAVIIAGQVYITRDGLLHIAHLSGQLDGIEVATVPDEGGKWAATATVHRKDMSRPFTYTAYQVEHENPQSPAWRNAPRAMTQKCAEVMALRRAFNVPLGGAEEIGYDVATGAANLGTAALVEVPRDDEPVRPAKASRPWTVERALAYVAKVANPLGRRIHLARWMLSQANDLPTITQYRAALVPLLDEDLFADHYLARYEALGGVVSGRGDEPIDAEYEAWPDGPEGPGATRGDEEAV